MTTPTYSPARSRRLLHWLILLPLTALAAWLLLQAGRGNQASTDLYQWDDAGFRLVPGLPYLYAATILLYTCLCFLAFLLHTTPAHAVRVRPWFGALVILALAAWTRFAAARLWTPILATDLTILVGRNAPVWRTVLILLDLLAVFLLMTALLLRRKSVWWAALYAWHPLVIVEVANGHLATLGILFLAILALATSFPAPAALRRPPLSHLATAGVTTLAATLSFIAFLGPTLGNWPPVPAAPGLLVNLLYRLLHRFNPNPVGIELWILFLLALTALLALALYRRFSLPTLLSHALILGLLFAPAPTSWQLLAPLFLLPLAWHRATWTLSLTATALWLLPALHWTQLPDWLLLAAYLPVIALELTQLAHDARAPQSMPSPAPALAPA